MQLAQEHPVAAFNSSSRQNAHHTHAMLVSIRALQIVIKQRAQHTNIQLTNLDGDREKSLINFSILFLNGCKRVFHCSNSQLHNIVSGERAAALARWHILYDSQIDLPVNFVCEAPCASYARRPVIV